MLIHFFRRILQSTHASRNLATVVALRALVRITVFCFLARRKRVAQLEALT
jgi:hypothetical protein